MLFAINLDTLTTEERTFFQNGTEFGILGATGNLGATVDLLKTVLTESREIFVWTHGFSSPPVGVNGDVITLKDRPKTARQS